MYDVRAPHSTTSTRNGKYENVIAFNKIYAIPLFILVLFIIIASTQHAQNAIYT